MIASILVVTLLAVADRSTVELTTTGRKSGEPRTATIWFVVEGGHVFVQAGKDGKQDWYRNLLKTPEVALGFGDLRVRGRAAPIGETKEVERVHALFREKYWTARIAGWLGLGFGRGRVVRIEPAAPP